MKKRRENSNNWINECESYSLQETNGNYMYIYLYRISGTFSCDVNLLRYPLDHQMCPLTIESCKYTFIVSQCN